MTDPITQPQLNALERAIDSVFGKLGIDINFTRHFLDRVNDDRNGRQITIIELGQLFAKEYRRWGQRISKMSVDAEAVMRDLSSAINIPFVINPNSKGKEMVAKTVMRKKDFRTPDLQLPVESVETGKQVRGSEPIPRKRRPSSGGETPHPMRGRLVGEANNVLLDVPTPSILQVAQRHGMNETDLVDQLESGIRVELEHTSDMQTAMEIALDHLNEQPDYYTRLAGVEGDTFTPESVRASWEEYQQLDELRDPREAILQKALRYLDQKIKGNATVPKAGHLGGQTLGSYAFDIVREFNLTGIATARELATMYRDWHGDSIVREGWMESNMYYLDEVSDKTLGKYVIKGKRSAKKNYDAWQAEKGSDSPLEKDSMRKMSNRHTGVTKAIVRLQKAYNK